MPSPSMHYAPVPQAPSNWARGSIPLVLDGYRGNRIQHVKREPVRPIVAQVLEKDDWNEAVLDEILRQMDLNVGPPMVDVRS